VIRPPHTGQSGVDEATPRLKSDGQPPPMGLSATQFFFFFFKFFFALGAVGGGLATPDRPVWGGFVCRPPQFFFLILILIFYYFQFIFF
jgi:hypothetical protein